MSKSACPDPQRIAIGSRLRKAREIAGLSQNQVAEMLGLHRPSVSELEAGRRRVSADELARLVDIYDVEVSWLVGGDDEGASLRDDELKLAARELGKLKPDDFNRLMQLLRMMRSTEDRAK